VKGIGKFVVDRFDRRVRHAKSPQTAIKSIPLRRLGATASATLGTPTSLIRAALRSLAAGGTIRFGQNNRQPARSYEDQIDS
jgi:hypothetical protein